MGQLQIWSRSQAQCSSCSCLNSSNCAHLLDEQDSDEHAKELAAEARELLDVAACPCTTAHMHQDHGRDHLQERRRLPVGRQGSVRLLPHHRQRQQQGRRRRVYRPTSQPLAAERCCTEPFIHRGVGNAPNADSRKSSRAVQMSVQVHHGTNASTKPWFSQNLNMKP